MLPVSILCRLLLLRLSSLRSLDSRKCLGLRCLMLFLDRSIFTMSDGRSDGMLFKSAKMGEHRHVSSSTLKGAVKMHVKNKSRVKGVNMSYHKTKQIKSHCSIPDDVFAGLRQMCTTNAIRTQNAKPESSGELEILSTPLYIFKMLCGLCATFNLFKMVKCDSMYNSISLLCFHSLPVFPATPHVRVCLTDR